MKKNQNRHLHSGCGEPLQSNLLDDVLGSTKKITNKGIEKVSGKCAGWSNSGCISGGKEKNPNE